jgi:hypothetical protein
MARGLLNDLPTDGVDVGRRVVLKVPHHVLHRGQNLLLSFVFQMLPIEGQSLKAGVGALRSSVPGNRWPYFALPNLTYGCAVLQRAKRATTPPSARLILHASSDTSRASNSEIRANRQY